METMGEISAAINAIDAKKENLRRSFLQLQSQFASTSSLNLTLKWADLDSYLTTLRSSLDHKFHLLQTLHPSPDTTTVLARPQLKSFCHNSDGLGLRQFMLLATDRLTMLDELPDAYRCAPDAAAMVLDAMEGFYNGNPQSRFLKGVCVIMLEGLMRVKPDVTLELKDKAMQLAVQWNRKRASGSGRDKEHNALGFLFLLGAYGLIEGFDMDHLIDCYVIIAKRRHAFDLCRQMIPADTINDLIQKLISKDMQVVAAKFSIEFEKTKEFPPVGLLEERKLMSERTVEEISKNASNHQVYNEVTLKEVNALKSIIRFIDNYNLNSEYPKDPVVALVKKLENEMGIRKRKALPLFKPKKPKVNKFIQVPTAGPITSPYGPAVVGPSSYLPQSHPPSGYYGNFASNAAEYHPPYYPQ